MSLANADSPRSVHNSPLDLIRAAAAFLVFFCHLRGHFFVAWGDLDPASRTGANFALFTLGRLGRESVMVFFVLSGYLVGGKSLQTLFAGKFQISGYLASRIARFYAVVPAALIVTFICDFFSSSNPAIQQPRLEHILVQSGHASGDYGSVLRFQCATMELGL